MHICVVGEVGAAEKKEVVDEGDHQSEHPGTESTNGANDDPISHGGGKG